MDHLYGSWSIKKREAVSFYLFIGIMRQLFYLSLYCLNRKISEQRVDNIIAVVTVLDVGGKVKGDALIWIDHRKGTRSAVPTKLTG